MMKRNRMQNVSWKLIMKIITSFIFISLIIAFFPVSATIFIEDGTELDEQGLIQYLKEPAPDFEKPGAIYFYDPNCGACMPVHDFWDTYLKENPDVILEQVNLEEGADQMDRFKEFSQSYNREKTFIPLVYLGPVALEGTDDIKNYFDIVYTWYMASFTGE
jgi:hypothetical protein